MRSMAVATACVPAAAWCLAWCAGAAQAADRTHCAASERVVFSCPIEGSGKVLSLCASRRFDAGQGALSYRFGKPGAPELQFPESAQGSLSRFRYARYFRYRTDRSEVSFTIGDTDYTVFDDYDGETGVDRYSRGVSVTDRSAEGVQTLLECGRGARSNLRMLDGVVPCDAGSALADCGAR